MRFTKLDGTYLVRLEKGEEVIDNLTRFLQTQGITAGWIEALGALQEAELGYYNLHEKKYYYSTVDWVEVVSLVGNIALLEGKPMIHAHIAVGDSDFNLKGGHLKEAIVAATMEVLIHAFNATIERLYDEEIGLNLWEI